MLRTVGGWVGPLITAHRSSELNLLINHLLHEANVASNTSTSIPTVNPIPSKLTNQVTRSPTPSTPPRLRRVKRNFLGEILHTLTGVATDEQLQVQLRRDEEIRVQVASVLAHQVSYETEVSASVANLNKEEEMLAAQVATLSSDHLRDIKALVRLSAYEAMVDSDLQLLEDLLASVMSGTAPARLSSYLSYRSGLQHSSPFSYLQMSVAPKGLEVVVTASLYHDGEVVDVLTSLPAHP